MHRSRTVTLPVILGGVLALVPRHTAGNTITVNDTADPFEAGRRTLPRSIEKADDTSTGEPNTDSAIGDPRGADTTRFGCLSRTMDGPSGARAYPADRRSGEGIAPWPTARPRAHDS
jgi:hypothetical protein